jgi:hypothetical protein
MRRINLALTGLLACVIVLGTILGFQLSANARQQRRIDELQRRLADKTRIDALDLQTRCATQAGVVFRQMIPEPNRNDRYESHYNPAVGTCFVLVEAWTVKQESLTWIVRHVLRDAMELRDFASFEGRYVAPTPPGPGVCELGPSPMSRCNSYEEFRTFVNRYMER